MTLMHSNVARTRKWKWRALEQNGEQSESESSNSPKKVSYGYFTQSFSLGEVIHTSGKERNLSQVAIILDCRHQKMSSIKQNEGIGQ